MSRWTLFCPSVEGCIEGEVEATSAKDAVIAYVKEFVPSEFWPSSDADFLLTVKDVNSGRSFTVWTSEKIVPREHLTKSARRKYKQVTAMYFHVSEDESS